MRFTVEAADLSRPAGSSIGGFGKRAGLSWHPQMALPKKTLRPGFPGSAPDIVA
jgi:hypothetical protein